MSIDYLVIWDQINDPDDGETRSHVLIKRYAREIERQALERAAQECDALESKFAKLEPVDGSYLNACDDCAERIRALIDTQSSEDQK